MAESKKWTTLKSFSLRKKRANSPPIDTPPPEKKRVLEPSEGPPDPAVEKTIEVLQKEEAGAPVVDLEAEAPSAKVARVLARTLESAQEPPAKEATKVVNISDSPVKLPLKTGDRRELSVVVQTPMGGRLEPGKILLKDEDVERFFSKVDAPGQGLVKTTLVICSPTPLSESIPLPSKVKRPSFPRLLPAVARNDEKKEEKGGKGRKGEGSKMEEVTKKKEEVLRVAPEVALDIGQEATWGID
ncbi:hypothetical protein AXF42_Ash020415 [Apostasia shenzhenica]|uniref:Uncharacterized protein n=1 Tax=Apostasia shenzhenica TaxID=1088818 RepID=A0A2I0AA86_9ASPA|nr:hypothetical protein AXF42_Ash020415 [Apostasia shenzhenica]